MLGLNSQSTFFWTTLDPRAFPLRINLSSLTLPDDILGFQWLFCVISLEVNVISQVWCIFYCRSLLWTLYLKLGFSTFLIDYSLCLVRGSLSSLFLLFISTQITSTSYDFHHFYLSTTLSSIIFLWAIWYSYQELSSGGLFLYSAFIFQIIALVHSQFSSTGLCEGNKLVPRA